MLTSPTDISKELINLQISNVVKSSGLHRKASFSPFDGNTGRPFVRYARFTLVNELFKREGNGRETTKGE